MNKNDYISKYIDFYAGSKIKQRGKRLYNANAVNLVKYNDKDDVYYFKVKGSRMYDVAIKNLNKKDITTSCTCPYDWGSVCKHTVATLLYLKDKEIVNKSESGLPIKKKTTERRSAKEDIILEEYKLLTEKYLKTITGSTTYQNVRYSDFEVENVEIEKNKIIFSLVKKYDDYYGYTNNKEEVVAFTLINDKLHISSSENTTVGKGNLKQTELFCLLRLINSNSANFFDLVFNEGLNFEKERVVNNYGLDINDFDKYFKIGFDIQKGIVFYKKEQGFGLVSVNNFENEGYAKLLNFMSDDVEISFPKSINKKELLVGFILNKDLEYGYDEANYSFIPFSAKPNKFKTKLISRFSQLYDVFEGEVLFTQEQKELINLINNFQDSDEIDAFNLSKQIFLKLSKQEFVYACYDAMYDRIPKNSLETVDIYPEPIKASIYIYNDGKFIGAEVKLNIEGNIVGLSEINTAKSDVFIVSYKKTLYHFNSYKDVIIVNELTDGIKMVNTAKNEFFEKVILQLSKNFEINFGKNTFQNTKIELDFKKRQVYLSEKDDFIVIQPQVVYDNDVAVLLSSEGNSLQKNEKTDEIIEFVRNFELEDEFLEQLSELHQDFESQKANKYFYLDIEEFTNNLWFYGFFDELNSKGIEIYGFKNLKKVKYSPYKGKIATSIKSGQDWFDLEVKVSFGDNLVKLSDIKKAVINKQKYIQLKDGSVGVLPEEWLNKLEKYFRNGTIKKDKIEISKLRFSIIDELFDNIDDTKIIEELNEKRKRLSEFKEISKTKIPKQITAELRHYQKEGVNWLNFLNDMGWGGILADDMGLGKTLQILAFIQQIVKKDKTPNLIVVPTTLLFNWKAEIEKFAPELKAFYHYGADRQKNTKEFKKYNLIFTSYGVLLRDIEILSKYKFNYLVLDESQAIKNPASRRFKAANLINSKNKIALTGTPIENSTFDLFAQMSFVNPGIFGGINNFKENYSNPIDKEANELVAQELQKIINPFILRRTKENVATELPPKTEDVIFCEMEPEQQRIYDAYKNEYRDKLLKNVEKEGIGKSKIMVLEALTRLRQICDSPALIKSEDYTSQSIKIKEIINHITKKTANHKVLIFSQFVSMLGLIKDELDKINISYEYLDGQSNSKQRENSVNNFQLDNDLRVFLISLKAGGTGLNLTAADYVYIIDPWWNPAVENQAIDRCYRIGQDKKVFAYRMICKNTVEEKILDLQSKKKKIASDIIQTDENIMKTLNLSDIKSLFK